MSLAELKGTPKAATYKVNTNVSPVYVAKVAAVKAAPKGLVISKATQTSWSQPIIPITLDPIKLVSAFVSMGKGTTVGEKVNAAASIIATEKTTTTTNMGVTTTTVQPYAEVLKENIAAAPPEVKNYFNMTATPLGAVSLPEIKIPEIKIPDIFGGLKEIGMYALIAGALIVGAIVLTRKK